MSSRGILTVVAACVAVTSGWSLAADVSGAFADPPWRYTLEKPAGDWSAAAFNDAGWRESPGGFGTAGTPGARVGTPWTTKEIWLRRVVELQALPDRPALYVHHDEDAEIFLNGRRVASLPGFQSEYRVVPLNGEARNAVVAGRNTLAVHCRQTAGGQFIDVHLIDADSVPRLPATAFMRVPFQSELVTAWGRNVTPQTAWREYPRPQMVREAWTNLNGEWDYRITPLDVVRMPTEWDGKIVVPYCLESRLGGVRRLLDPSEALWYRRVFDFPHAGDRRTLLHFEAVDYRCRVYVNGIEVGGHVGGNTCFSLDVSAAVRPGPNDLVVRVEDTTEGSQLRGKQALAPSRIFYTRVSGIWQTVWMEPVPPTHVADLAITTDAGSGSITVRPIIGGDDQRGLRVSLEVSDGGKEVGRVEGTAGEPLTVAVARPRLWTPRNPHLYDLIVSLRDAEGRTIDAVRSYAGIRTVGKRRDSQGHLRFTLNGEEVFHWGTLDQGWWPDGLLTPPSDAAMQWDIEFLKDAGFNMIRKHIKVEPRRYYHHCDRLGMLVWQDQVSGGRFAPWTRLVPNPKDAAWSDADHAQFMAEFEEMVASLGNHPSIVMWVPFNEGWGQHRTLDVGRWIANRDPTRSINIASGGNFWPIGDVIDQHAYPHPAFPFDESRDHGFVKVVGEFGGHGFVVPGHTWNAAGGGFGYGGVPNGREEYAARYRESIRQLALLKAQGIAGGVYTQTTDIEGEVNGLTTYDRAVAKIPAVELREIHRALGFD